MPTPKIGKCRELSRTRPQQQRNGTARSHLLLLAIIASLMAIDTYWRQQHHFGNDRSLGKSSQMTFDDSTGAASISRLRQLPFFTATIEETENVTVKPAVAWLMSYPNSGTKYTMSVVRKASNRSVGSNYGSPDSQFLDPKHLQPPFWDGLGELPSTFLLTQTHCGGCHDCRQAQHPVALPTTASFLQDCSFSQKATSSGKKISLSYPPTQIARAVHLVRNPFHNIAEKFKRVQRVTSEYPKDSSGFQKWCTDLDQQNGEDVYEKLKSVPCHSELFKFLKWHNLAHEALVALKVPTLTVHYEDYANETHVETVSKLMDFLELDAADDWSSEPFIQPSLDYDAYFLDEQMEAMTYFAQKVATEATWNDVKTYFPAPYLLQEALVTARDVRPKDAAAERYEESPSWVADINSVLVNRGTLEALWQQ